MAVEREYVGVCLNVGCIPSKSLLKNAAVMRLIQDAKTYGVELGRSRRTTARPSTAAGKWSSASSTGCASSTARTRWS